MDKEQKKRVKGTLAAELAGVRSLGGTLGSSFVASVEMLQTREGKIVVTGVGKSGFIGMKLAATLTSLGHTAAFLHPVEALHGDSGIVGSKDVVIAISFSGESQEVIKIVRYLKKAFSVDVIGITGNKESSLAKESDHILLVPVKREGCPIGLAPMASTTATLVLGDLIASALTSPDTFRGEHFARFHPGGTLGLSLARVEDAMTVGNTVPLVREDASLHSALREITKQGFGIVGITDTKRILVGVITDGDVRRFLLKHPSIEGACAKEAMTRNPRVIRKGQSIKEALECMELHEITNLFVVENGKPVGIIHIHDIIEDYMI